MKKIVAVMIMAALLASMSFAVAEPVSSPVAPAVVLDEVLPVGDVQMPDGFVLAVMEEEQYPETVAALHEEIQTMVLSGKNIVDMFTEEEQQAMSEILPEAYDLNKMQITEYIPVAVAGYTADIGDVNAVFAVPGEYTETDVVIAMFGLIAGSESADENETNITWMPIAVQVVDGKLQVILDQEAMTLIMDQETVLVILKGIDETL